MVEVVAAVQVLVLLLGTGPEDVLHEDLTDVLLDEAARGLNVALVGVLKAIAEWPQQAQLQLLL